MDQQGSGISNRESSAEEAKEREAHPPRFTDEPPLEDAAGLVGDPVDDHRDEQTSRKSGSRSTAQKEAGSRYPEGPTPYSNKVPGAFGREPNG